MKTVLQKIARTRECSSATTRLVETDSGKHRNGEKGECLSPLQLWPIIHRQTFNRTLKSQQILNCRQVSIFIKAPLHLPTIKGCLIHTNSNICTARLYKVGTSNIHNHFLQVSATLPKGVCLSIVIKASYILVLHNRRWRRPHL